MSSTSIVWKYFEKINKETSRCKLCLKYLKSSGNTTNLKKHLGSYHKNVLARHLNASRSSANEDSMSESTPTKKKKDELIQTKLVADERKAEGGSSTKTLSIQEKLESSTEPQQAPPTLVNPIKRAFESHLSIKEGGSRHAVITNAILYYICVDCKPFYTVQTRGFLKLMKTVAPNYKVPSDTHMKKLMSDRYGILKNALKEKLNNLDGFCVTCDIWTETMTMTSFLGVTLHYLEGTTLKSAYIATVSLHERHTAVYISKKLSEVLDEWNLPKTNIMAIVTDNGANMVAAVKHLFDGSPKHLPCFAHTINLIAEKILSEGDISNFVEKIRDIVKYFKKSVMATDDLKKAQCLAKETSTPKKLILDVKTRWNSCFYMAERFIDLAPVISPLLLKDQTAPPMLSATELNHLKELIFLLKPLEYVTREVSGEQYITISKVIPLINCLISQITTLELKSQMCVKTKELLQEQIQRRFGAAEKVHLLAVSTILDPRFKSLHFKNAEACANALSLLRRTISERSSSPNASSDSDTDSIASESDFWHKHKELAHRDRGKKTKGLNDELSVYIQNPVAPLKSNPMETWEALRKVFPGLYRQFRRHAMIVASSVPAERLFSKAGATATQERNRLKPKRLEELLFLAGRPEEEWF